MRTSLFPILGLLLVSAAAAADPEPANKQATLTTKATYLITGLHCPPCTKTVERSLKGVKGVKSVKVDWTSKNAQVDFDEKVLPAQQLAGRIAATQHMMGGDMQYGGWLALQVPDVKDAAKAKEVKGALSQIKGVKQVAVYPTQKSVGVKFDGDGKLTSDELIKVLKEAGFEAKNL